jgi:cytoskeletal protein RodZ
MIVAIVLIVLLVLGGGGVAVWVLTKGDDKDNTASGGDDDKTTAPSSETSETSDETTTEESDPSDDATNTPDDVRDAYMEAYENKSFGAVVATSCAAYKSKYGTDTSSLEKTLSAYDITATASGEPDINGNTATANIDLTLSADGTTEKPSIFIKIVEEDGQWRFCGEGKAPS